MMVFETDKVPAEIFQAITFAIPGRPPNTNDANRQTSPQKWRVRREWRKIAADYAGVALKLWELKHGQTWTSLSRATLRVTFIVPTKARRDWDNLASSLKPLLDGIVDAGILNDDSIYVLPHVYTEFEHRPGISATEFEFTDGSFG